MLFVQLPFCDKVSKSQSFIPAIEWEQRAFYVSSYFVFASLFCVPAFCVWNLVKFFNDCLAKMNIWILKKLNFRHFCIFFSFENVYFLSVSRNFLFQNVIWLKKSFQNENNRYFTGEFLKIFEEKENRSQYEFKNITQNV